MKIGILTFHWATNYGAVLQAYALQKHLAQAGHNVYVIDYKPAKYDFSWSDVLKHPGNLLHLRRYICRLRKEKKLDGFRRRYLHLTERYCSYQELKAAAVGYDVLISGSDQVLNPYFTMHGEGGPTSVYYLDFPDCGCLKLGYALSFGCLSYPEDALGTAVSYIRNFDKVSVREDSAVGIVGQLHYPGSARIVPDPTVLTGKNLFEGIGIGNAGSDKPYVCVYMLRRSLPYDLADAVYIDEVHQSYSMEEWLALIRNSKILVTNSYHGMIMALLFHIPFIVELEEGGQAGMNDRFITVLKRLNLLSRIDDGRNFTMLLENVHIDWEDVDKKLAEFRTEGEAFLKLD